MHAASPAMVNFSSGRGYDDDMLVIDAMTGTKFYAKSVGVTHYPEYRRPTISYGDHSLVIARVDAGIPFLRPATCYGWSFWNKDGRTVGEDVHVPLSVRFTHPNYFWQLVAFIPS